MYRKISYKGLPGIVNKTQQSYLRIVLLIVKTFPKIVTLNFPICSYLVKKKSSPTFLARHRFQFFFLLLLFYVLKIVLNSCAVVTHKKTVYK